MKDFLLVLIQHYGYAAVLLSTALGIIGLPIPIEFLLLFAGSITAQTHLPVQGIIAFAWMGTVLGMITNYALGRYIGFQRMSRVTRWIHLTEDKMNRWSIRFQKFGPLFIVTGFFVAGLRHIAPFIAGASRMRFAPFIGATMLGSLGWVGIFAFLGQRLGHYGYTLLKLAHHPLPIALLLLLIGAVVLYLRTSGFKMKPVGHKRAYNK
ncbi:DedA family protein [Paenibacillus sp. RC67]|uniref:DedA family protein n=1 Tax=Paenibacillus sp. RC67 TaxID=3039392 RepID=UPI0024AC9252|nr:DedA family protein [Paenibacillus sp. RC67]